MMKLSNLEADILVSVSGGVVNGVFGPNGATVLLVDFDNIREGDVLSVTHVDETTGSKECREVLTQAIDMIAKRQAQES